MYVAGAHADQLTQRLEVLSKMAARNRAAGRAVFSTAGFAAGYGVTHLGDALSGAGALADIAHAVRAQRDLSLAKSGRLVRRAERGGVGGERLIERLREAEREDLTVVLVFDDAHAADEKVCGLLEELLAGPMPVGVMCVCTARSDLLDGPFGSWLVSAVARFPDRVRRVPVARLTDADVTDLVVAYARRTTGDRVRAFVERADGNPLALEGLLEEARWRGGVQGEAVTLPRDDIKALPTAEDTLRATWRATAREVREVLAIASAQGRSFIGTLALTGCDLAGLSPRIRSPDTVLRSAVEAGHWVIEVGEVLLFREQYGFELASQELGQMLPTPEQHDAVCVGLAAEVGRWKAAPHWQTLSDQVKVMLLHLHVGLLTRCRDEALASVDHASVAASAEELARSELQLGAPRAAMLAFEKAAEYAARLPLAHPAALVARGNIAVATYLAGGPADSIDPLETVLEEYERLLGSKHPDTLAAAANLGIALYDSYRFSEAATRQLWVLQQCEEVLGSRHPETIAARINLAATLADSGQLAEAIRLQDQVISDLTREFGADDADTWIARAALARSTSRHGQVLEAVELFQSVIDHQKRVLGTDHPATLTSRHNLALTYASAGDLAHAVPLLKQTLADRERVLGSDHPDTLSSRHNLGTAYRAAGDLVRAIPLLEQTLAATERILGADDPRALSARDSLALAYKAAGDLARAVPLFAQTLADRERVLGSDHPDTLGSRHNLGTAYRAQGDLARARILLEQTIAVKERVLDADHPDTLISRAVLAGVYREAGDHARAILLFEQVLRDMKRVLGANHRSTLTTQNNLALAYQSGGYFDSAIVLFEQTLRDMQRVLGTDHPETVHTQKNLAGARAAARDQGPPASSVD